MIEQLKASAGSGKTFTLTKRFTALLLGGADAARLSACGARTGSGYDASEILAITFTNKAAAEMKERALASLKGLALARPGDASARDRKKAARELERILLHAQRLNIRTIDSLLNCVTRLFALEMGLSPDFETVFGEAEYFEPLFDRFAGEMQTGDPKRRALLDQAARSLLLVDNAPGFWIRDRLKDRLREVFVHLLKHPEQTPNARGDDLIRMAERDLGALRLAAADVAARLTALGAAPLSHFTAMLAKLQDAAPFGVFPDSTYGDKDSLADCVKKASKDLIGDGEEAAYRNFRRIYAHCRNVLPILKGAAAFAPFAELAAELADMFERFITERGILPAALWPEKVKGLLSDGGAPDAWCRMGASLFHLLIDEFQDTSLEQWEALDILAGECLSKGGSFFYVGDVKQAIYGWRGGEAELFDRAPEESGLTDLAAITRGSLPCNWRSAKEVVDFNNRFFTTLGGPAANEAADALMPGAPPEMKNELARRIENAFADAGQALPEGREGRRGLVGLHALFGETSAEREESIRAEIVRLLREDILLRRAPGDVAILTRSNAQASLVSSWLIAEDIPVITENSLLLSDHPLINQLTAFLAFLDYPPDNQAFWRFVSGRELFGDVSGLTRETLLDWLCGAQRGRPLYAAFREDFPQAWTRLIRPFVRQAGLTSPYDLAWEVLCAYGAFTRRPQDEAFLRRFMEICHLAEKNGHISLAAFTDFWSRLGVDEKAPQPERVDAVRVMTMHKSKGLEFPVAIIPFLNFPSKTGEGLDVLDVDGRQALVPLSRRMGEAYYRKSSAGLLEQLNLLYVAFTRAVSELRVFLPGSEKLRAKTPLLRAVDAVLDELGLDVGDEPLLFGTPPAPRPASPEAPADAPQPDAFGQTARTETIPPPLAWIPRLKVYRNSVRDLRLSLSFTEKKRGILAHAAVESLQRLLADGHEPSTAMEHALDQALAAAPPDPELRRALREDFSGMMAWLLDQPGFGGYLADGLPERELLDAEGAKHRPDLMASLQGETVIIDYKTGAPSPEHEKQVRRYLRLASELPGAPPAARGFLAYLDAKTLTEVRLEQP